MAVLISARFFPVKELRDVITRLLASEIAVSGQCWFSDARPVIRRRALLFQLDELRESM